MNYKSFNLGDWIGHISGAIEDERELDGNEMRDLVEFLTTLNDAKLITHAHWIEGQTDNPNIHNILCSHCFNGYPSKGHANSQYVKEKFKWCPSCGSKMDKNERKLKYADENKMMSAI